MSDFSEKQIKDHFAQLPKVLQDAITSVEIEGRLREVADTHKLHLDQWNLLENQVMLTLMGLERAEDLRQNIIQNVGTDDPTAAALAADISRIVFDPVRAELERQLEHPDAQAKETPAVENIAAQIISADQSAPAAQAVALAPPPAAPEMKAIRAPISEEYKPGETSAARKDVHNDPYREPPK